MQEVLIDAFVIPDESRQPFLERSRVVQSFLKTLPSFVEGFLHEKTEGDGRHSCITTAVWESAEAFENAKIAAAAEFQRRGFDPQDATRRWKIEAERAVFARSPY
jgi:heme-degrading monooxygenase HmoA